MENFRKVTGIFAQENDQNTRFLEIRHAFVAKRPKCAPFSTQILDKRQVL